MQNWHIHIKGQVQGVGFRPFVFRIAQDHNLHGWVNNTIDGVHVEVNGGEAMARSFLGSLLREAPDLSIISGYEIYPSKEQLFSEFKIVHSESEGEANLLLTPDFAMCKDCRRELLSSADRRANYPFLTCTNCGPRYSITQRLPYDRETTTMKPFQMCPTCQGEYGEPLDRRYFSQTNSCPNCAIQLSLFDASQNLLSQNTAEIIDLVVEKWQSGRVVAIKGIGGYLLTCDASNRLAINKLRKRKHRPTKPFALMYPNLEVLADDVNLRDAEREELNKVSAPIVLLDLKNQPSTSICRKAIAPGLDSIGVMLPYTPLYELLLQKFGNPIVATSGNVSNSPIVFKDKKALNELSQIADFILVNNRKIVVPQDDSVVKFSHFHQQKIVLRRSRGMAPSYVNPKLDLPTENILATGAMLKSTFTFQHRGNTFISQYLGDLEAFDTQENYRHTVKHFFRLFGDQPQRILTDKHPEYASTQFGATLAQDWDLPLEKIQHHIAHFGAVLGEHCLVDYEEPILGVIWDGTGLGDDGQVWGGEFFTFKNHDFQRCNHFEYFDFILGDKMPREPRISALTATREVHGADGILQRKFTPAEWSVYTKLLEKGSKLKTSSVGRIFDAVASLLGVMDKSSYEGEAAMLLEQLASRYFQKNGLEFHESYFEGKALGKVPTKVLMAGIVEDLKNGKPTDFVAAKFHFSLAKLVESLANQLKIKKIAFSGGVFQNSLLVDLLCENLTEKFQLFFHKQLSPNDESVSFGQLVCHQIQRSKKRL